MIFLKARSPLLFHFVLKFIHFGFKIVFQVAFERFYFFFEVAFAFDIRKAFVLAKIIFIRVLASPFVII